ncbi:MAG TPA: M66 family metalloprotease [Polyangia bacterium]
MGRARTPVASLTLALAAGLTACGGGADPLPMTGMPGAPNAMTEPAPLATPHACGVRVRELAVFQGVKVPLVLEGNPVPAGIVPLIEGRSAVFRAYVSATAPTVMGNARARLRIESSLGRWDSPSEGFVNLDSTEDQIDSSFNFVVPGEIMRGDVRVALDFELGNECATAGRTSHPATGTIALALQPSPPLKLTLVPVVYEADGSSRLPDTSPEQLERYRAIIMAMYPVSAVDITVRAPFASRVALTSGGGWGALLDSVRALRASDNVGRDVHYYALVSPAASFANYCSRSCIAGLSYLAGSTVTSQTHVGAGVGFAGAVAGETLIHELGHQHGRAHAPCGADDLDTKYPHVNARLGAWGLDQRGGILRMINPATRYDMMSYCNPIWISDYNYGALAARRQAINATVSARVVDSNANSNPLLANFRGFRTLLVGEGAPVWGNPIPAGELPNGRPETANALDARGQVVGQITVYRNDYGHGVGASYDVPAPEKGWSSVQIAGQPPLSFAAPAAAWERGLRVSE